jgi:chromosome segregation ATPase
MLSPDQLQERMTNLSTRYSKILRRKAELGGELKSKKAELSSLVQEIHSAGYNPKTLVADRDKLQGELEELLNQFESKIVESETILSEFDKK